MNLLGHWPQLMLECWHLMFCRHVSPFTLLTLKMARADKFLVTELKTEYWTSRAGHLWRASFSSSRKVSHTHTLCTHTRTYTGALKAQRQYCKWMQSSDIPIQTRFVFTPMKTYRNVDLLHCWVGGVSNCFEQRQRSDICHGVMRQLSNWDTNTHPHVTLQIGSFFESTKF